MMPPQKIPVKYGHPKPPNLWIKVMTVLQSKLEGAFGSPDFQLGENFIGGAPIGIEEDQWPRSPDGTFLTFIAQFELANHPSFSQDSGSVYVFMAQTYYVTTGECLHETWDPTNGSTRVMILRNRNKKTASNGPMIVQMKIGWSEGWGWDFPNGDDMPEAYQSLLEEESNQELYSRLQLGGYPRWLQSGDQQPLDSKGHPLPLIFALDATDYPQLSEYLTGVMYVFLDTENPELGILVWEAD
jgi:hypothetical protein